jgi:hypothetical protein
MVTWPFLPMQPSGILGVMAGAHPDFAPNRMSEIRLVPVAFFSRLMSEGFWKDPTILRKSAGFFYRITSFCSRCPHHADRRAARPNPVIDDRVELELLRIKLELSEAMIDMVADWDQRQSRKPCLVSYLFILNHASWKRLGSPLLYIKY